MFPFGPTHETTEKVFESVYSLNAKAPYFVVAAQAPAGRPAAADEIAEAIVFLATDRSSFIHGAK